MKKLRVFNLNVYLSNVNCAQRLPDAIRRRQLAPLLEFPPGPLAKYL